MHPQEVSLHQDRLGLIFNAYCECKVFDYAHLTFEQFLNMTKEDADDLLVLCSRQRDKASNKNKDQAKELEDMLKNKK